MDKMKMRSSNITQNNIEKIAVLFPNCITERKKQNGTYEKAIDFQMLQQELSFGITTEKEERYQFTWPGKRDAILSSNSPTSKTLRPLRMESFNFDSTENLYIEGDNLDVLKVLQETYLNKVKMIYIDPPYNTGKDSFVYNDNFNISQDEFSDISGQYDEDGNLLFDMRSNNETNGKFHSDWLTMIYPRLKLAKDLLTDDGVILINMDENEITNLQKVCQEIFGEQNDLGTIIWDKRNPKGDAQGISYQHEYIVVYAKNKLSFLENNKVQRPKKNASSIMNKAAQLYSRMSLSYTIEDINKDFATWMRQQSGFSGGEKAYNKIDVDGNVYRPVSMAWPNKKKAPDDYFIPLIHPITKKPCPVPDRGWRNPSSTMKRMQENGQILFGEDETTIPNSKYLLKENMYENIPSLLYNGGSDTAFLEEIGIPFDTPKMADICKEHILSFTSGDDIVLDFFSGSATVAHGVMLANAEDNCNRKFIMVQIPEKCDDSTALGQKGFSNICQAGIARIVKSAERIEANIDKGFRVLKLDSSNMKDVYYNPDEYEQDLFGSLSDNIKDDRTPEDLLFQVMLDLGVLLSSKIEETEICGKRVFDVADGFLYACFDADISDEVVKAIAQKQPYYAVFRDNGMASDSVMTNFDQIFAAISPTTVRKVL